MCFASRALVVLFGVDFRHRLTSALHVDYAVGLWIWCCARNGSRIFVVFG